MSSSSQVIESVQSIRTNTSRPHDFLFLPLKEAVEELKKRRKNALLKKQVWGQLLPQAGEVLEKFTKPRAVLFRQVATPTHETLRFLRLVRHTALNPFILEYHGDKFVSARNRYKRSLGKMPIYQHMGSDGEISVKYQTICDFPVMEGKKFSDVQLLNGDPLISFHHELLKYLAHFNFKKDSFDGTSWFAHIGLNARQYYEHVFSLFIRDGILFENYFNTSIERPFVEQVIIPAFENVTHQYGHKPLIVRLLPEKRELQMFWDSYPKKIEPYLKEKYRT